MSSASAEPNFKGVDVLLTSQWPKGVEKYACQAVSMLALLNYKVARGVYENRPAGSLILIIIPFIHQSINQSINK
jgi:hypothetical protein